MSDKQRFQIVVQFSSLRGMDRRIDGMLRKMCRVRSFATLSILLLRDLRLALIEAVTNALIHGKCGKHHPAEVFLKAHSKQIEIEVVDHGPGFDLAGVLKQPPSEQEIHGRGIWILKNLMDVVRYERRKNRLVLVRRLNRPKKIDAALELSDRLHGLLRQLKPMKTLYQEFLDYVVDLFNVERGSFLTLDPEEQVLRVAASKGISSSVAKRVAVRPGEGISGYVFQTARPLRVDNLSNLKNGSLKLRKKGYHSSSFISMPVVASPLHFGESVLGVINLTDQRERKRFTREEQKLLGLLARQAAGVFQTRDALETVRAHERMKKEFEIVGEIQHRLLPSRFPQANGLEVAGHCQLSVRGGGDYFDLVEIGGKLRGIIADVSGHHVGSAITMAGFRSIFRSIVYDENSPAELLQALRWAMHEDLTKLHQFISCWTFECAENRVSAAGAGHPPVFHYRRRCREWTQYDALYLPLGLEDDASVQDLQISLEGGDYLFFYTDGLFDPRMRLTGFDKRVFCRIVEENSEANPQAMVDKIISEVKPHHLALKSPDDVALMIFRRSAS